MAERTGNKGGRPAGVVANIPRLTTNLNVREKRVWQNRLLNAQEAAEKAMEAIEDVALAAYEASLSYATVGGILSIHGTTVKDMCDRADKRRTEPNRQGRS